MRSCSLRETGRVGSPAGRARRAGRSLDGGHRVDHRVDHRIESRGIGRAQVVGMNVGGSHTEAEEDRT